MINQILLALNIKRATVESNPRHQFGGRHIYEGTVDGVEKERRRAKNKRARAARRINRAR
jgi:hypothetical protein